MSALTDWLTSIGACAPGIASMASAPGIAAGYAAISQPDWLLWFCFAQTTDPGEKKRVLGILNTTMVPVLTSSAAGTPAAAPVAAVLDDVTAFLGGTLNQVAATAHLSALIDTAIPSGPAQKAAGCAAALLHTCLAPPGPTSGNAGANLARCWMSLLQLLGTLPNNGTAVTTLTTTLRSAIPLNNMTGLPT